VSDRPHVFDLDPAALRDLLRGWGEPAYRAEQVLQWVYQRGVADPAAMTNLPATLRDRLSDGLDFVAGEVVRHQHATDGTQKLLVDWAADTAPLPPGGDGGGSDTGGLQIAGSAPPPRPFRGEGDTVRLGVASDNPYAGDRTECVMIPTDATAESGGRRTACVSSQVGCPVGCRFCASGLGGLDRNLSTGQIVQQVWQLGRLLRAGGDAVGRVTNVVFMGMGEPLANFAAVSRAIVTLNAGWGLGISARRITVSTVGVPSGIRRLAEFPLPVTLAVSLHAPDDALRRQIIPWAEFVTIEQLCDAGRHYFEKTGREVTLEYILLGGFNDRVDHARRLASVAKRLRSNVNLIRYNEVAGLPYRRPATEDVRAFQQALRAAGVNAHIRASRGRDIAAACGQLRHESRQGQPAASVNP